MTTALKLLEKAKSYNTDEAPEGASRFLLGALLLDPSFEEALRFAVLSSRLRDDKSEIVSLSFRLLLIAPKDTKNRVLLASTLFGIGERDRASRILSEGICLNPRNVQLHYLLGLVRRQLNEQVNECVPHFKRAIILGPRNGNVLDPLVSYSMHMEKYADAVRYAIWCSMLHTINAESAALSSSLGFIAENYMKLNRPEDGLKWIKKFEPNLISKSERDKVSLDFSVLCLKSGKHEQAAPVLEHLAQDQGISYRADYVAYFSLLKYAQGDRAAYRRMVNRDLIWETDLKSGFSREQFTLFNKELINHVLNHSSLTVSTDGSHGEVKRTGYEGPTSILAEKGLPVRRLIDLLKGKIADYLAYLPKDPSHPFLGRINESTRLRLGRMWGLVVSNALSASRHHHGDAFLSAIYYADIPERMDGEEGPRAGWLEIGRPDFGIEIGDNDVFYIEPKIGKLVMFPSYFFHAVLPTQNKRARISVASDIMLA